MGMRMKKGAFFSTYTHKYAALYATRWVLNYIYNRNKHTNNNRKKFNSTSTIIINKHLQKEEVEHTIFLIFYQNATPFSSCALLPHT